MRWIETADDARRLAAQILAPRERPLVVISTDPSSGRCVIDAEEVGDQVSDVADVVCITTGDLTRLVDAALPDRTQVYGGAGRSYPADFASDPHWTRSPLRFPGAHATRTLIADALSHAHGAGLFDIPSPRSVRVAGTVQGFLAAGSRALVQVDGGTLVTVAQEVSFPPLPLDWVLEEGLRVEGNVDLDSQRLIIDPAPVDQSVLAAAYPHEAVTLALVHDVTPSHARLLLHPTVAPVTLSTGDISTNPLDTVDLLLSPGDVVASRVIHLSDRLHLRLFDVDDDEIVLPAVSLVAGGPPWLRAGRDLNQKKDLNESVDESSEEVAHDGGVGDDRGAEGGEDVVPADSGPRPGPGVRPAAPRPTSPTSPTTGAAGPALHSALLELSAARARVSALETQTSESTASLRSDIDRLREAHHSLDARLRATLADLGYARERIHALDGERRRSTKALRDVRRAQARLPAAESGPVDRRARWIAAEDWVRHEVYLAWVDRLTPAERASATVADYVVGPRFAESLLDLDTTQFDKAMRAAVDAVTGRIHRIPSREPHMLQREGRDIDGAHCWRAYIEQNTAAARRIHYWIIPGGTIELSRIVTHDDVQP